MTFNGFSSLDKIVKLIKNDRDINVPLIEFKHPKELEVFITFIIKYVPAIKIDCAC